jgi:glutathionylspermidine synthase
MTLASTVNSLSRSCRPVLRAGESLDVSTFFEIRRSMMLNGCKWDAQIGDVSTLSPFSLILRSDQWNQLARWAEQLTAETLAAEAELLLLPRLHARLGIPRKIRPVLQRAANEAVTPSCARVMRFDFHPTADGWRISEVNSDVPGGFTEASAFTQMMAEHCGRARPAGNPIQEWADAIAAKAQSDPHPVVALLRAAGHMEDHQIVAYLAGHLRQRGIEAHIVDPLHIVWRGRDAYLDSSWRQTPLAAIVRFYQCEWLPRLARNSQWPLLLVGGKTPVGNPGSAILTESKRFPLVWDQLRTPLPTWRRFLPDTRDPRDAPWRTDDAWLLKTAYCNTGDTVSIRGILSARNWRSVRRSVFFCPCDWIAQRRFDVLPVDSPNGPIYPCVGVYTIDGRAAGAYARYSTGRVIDYTAVDAALLLDAEDEGGVP